MEFLALVTGAITGVCVFAPLAALRGALRGSVDPSGLRLARWWGCPVIAAMGAWTTAWLLHARNDILLGLVAGVSVATVAAAKALGSSQ